MDNSVVTIASTVHVNKTLTKVLKYSHKHKKIIEINCPKLVQEYNKHMGGTDHQDQNVSKYRIAFQEKKWYWCIFTWMIDVVVQNA